MSILHFYPHQLPLTPYSRRFRLTGMELSFYRLITFLGPEKQEDYLGDSSSHNTFNVLDMCRVLIGSVSDKGVTSFSAYFFSIYIWRILLISSISSLLIFERESSSPLIPSIHLLLLSFYSPSVLRPFFRKLSYQ